MLGLRFCARAFSSCGEQGPLFIAVHGPLTIAASLVAEHRLQTRRLSSCGSRAQLLRSMQDLPRPGLEPVSPALVGRFSYQCATREAPSIASYKKPTTNGSDIISHICLTLSRFLGGSQHLDFDVSGCRSLLSYLGLVCVSLGGIYDNSFPCSE